MITVYNTDSNKYVEMITKYFSYLEDRLELSYKTLNILSPSKLCLYSKWIFVTPQNFTQLGP